MKKAEWIVSGGGRLPLDFSFSALVPSTRNKANTDETSHRNLFYWRYDLDAP